MDRPSITPINGPVNLKEFNRVFDEENQKLRDISHQKELDELQKMNLIENTRKPLSELTIGEIILNIADTYINMITDTFTLNFNSISSFIDIFIKDNRPFYIGLSFIIIGLISYLLQHYSLSFSSS